MKALIRDRYGPPEVPEGNSSSNEQPMQHSKKDKRVPRTEAWAVVTGAASGLGFAFAKELSPTWSASDLAPAILKAAIRGDLYFFPPGQDRFMWRFKRMMPVRTLKLGDSTNA